MSERDLYFPKMNRQGRNGGRGGRSYTGRGSGRGRGRRRVREVEADMDVAEDTTTPATASHPRKVSVQT